MIFYLLRGCIYLIMYENIYLFIYVVYVILIIEKFWFCVEKENKMIFFNKLMISKK